MFNYLPLRSANFRHLAAAYWVNEFGNWIGELALAILVYNRTGSPLATATLFLSLRFLPALLAPILTTRLEVLRPRMALSSLYVWEALLFVILAAFVHDLALGAILVLAACDGILSIAAKALARSTSATELVRLGLLREGNAILNLGAMASSALGPALGGALVAWRGAHTALLVDAASFLGTALIIITAKGLQIESDHEAGLSGRLRAGLAVLRTRPAVRRLMLLLAFALMLCSLPIPIEVVFAKDTLNAGDTGYGLLLASWGVGMVVGGAVFAVVTDATLTIVLGAGLSLMVVGYGGLAVAPTLAIACLFSAVGGVGNGAAGIAAVTAIQERIPLNTQGALMSVLEGLNQVMPAIGFALGGVITALSSPRLAYAVAAIGVGAVVVVAIVRPIDRVQLATEPGQESDFLSDNAPSLQETDLTQRTLSVPTLPVG